MIAYVADGLRVLTVYKDNEKPVKDWPVAVEDRGQPRETTLGEIWRRANGPADDDEPATPEKIIELIPATNFNGQGGIMSGKFGFLFWDNRNGDFTLTFCKTDVHVEELTMGRLRKLIDAIDPF